MLVAEDGADKHGVDAMTSSDVTQRSKAESREAKGRRAEILRYVGRMLLLTCAHVLHHVAEHKGKNLQQKKYTALTEYAQGL